MLRFAPSPTGDMHIGSLRVATLSIAIDKEHNIKGKDTEIMQVLEKFAIKHDIIYHQSEHLNIHEERVDLKRSILLSHFALFLLEPRMVQSLKIFTSYLLEVAS